MSPPSSKPQKNIPVILIAENAPERLDSLRECIRRLYFLSPFESTFKEFVLAFSIRKKTVWIWMVLRSATAEALQAIGEVAKQDGIGWVDLSHLPEEEKERHRETVVKHQESYQVFSAEDIDALLAVFIERVNQNG
ncbi:MAG: hypothetical protein HY282_01210 [Nitrospirae bacterium]|nr:hypothetical protein [Candidatus Manganitrophaceae bacterium]